MSDLLSPHGGNLTPINLLHNEFNSTKKKRLLDLQAICDVHFQGIIGPVIINKLMKSTSYFCYDPIIGVITG